jgi:phage tail sheath gpL-like
MEDADKAPNVVVPVTDMEDADKDPNVAVPVTDMEDADKAFNVVLPVTDTEDADKAFNVVLPVTDSVLFKKVGTLIVAELRSDELPSPRCSLNSGVYCVGFWESII